MSTIQPNQLPVPPTRARRAALTLILAPLAISCSDATGPTGSINTDPAAAQILTSDVDRFWRAYDVRDQRGTQLAFQQIYLDSASTTLRQFALSRSVTATALAQLVSVQPRYLDALRTWWTTTASRDAVFTTVRANFVRIKQLYPAAVFPPVTILIGRQNSGGTVVANGIVIGYEFFGADASAPTSELTPFARQNQKSWQADLAPLVAHEHAHVLQGAAGSRGGSTGATVLAKSMNEGVAEFVAELASGHSSFHNLFVSMQAREREFWLAFDRERTGTDASRWLYNQGQTTADWPGDLGYFIGYRIAQAYYARATDKAQALSELIAQRDAEVLYRASGYAGSGPALVMR